MFRKSQSSMWRTMVLGLSVAGACLCVVLLSAGPTPAPKRPGFVDVAPRSNITYISNNSPGGHKYFPQPMCGGVALFDYDNDGKLDIFFTNGAQLPEMKKTNPSYYNCLLKQKPDGTFEDVTAKAGLPGENLDFNFGVAVGDYDNDGYEDLFICSAGRNALYHNNGDGTFTDVTAASGIGGKPAEYSQRRRRLVRLRQRRPAGPDRLQLHLLDSANRPALHHGQHGLLLRSAALQERATAALPQPGPWQIRGCHREVGLGQVARQGHGHLHRRFQ